MAQYEISNQVRDNILKLMSRVDIKGVEAPMIMEIAQIFNPVKNEVTKVKKKDIKNV